MEINKKILLGMNVDELKEVVVALGMPAFTAKQIAKWMYDANVKDIDEMIVALDKVSPGLASEETLLYGVEVKFYSSKVVGGGNFETAIGGLYTIGDGAGITRGLMQASVTGMAVADDITGRM